VKLREKGNKGGDEEGKEGEEKNDADDKQTHL